MELLPPATQLELEVSISRPVPFPLPSRFMTPRGASITSALPEDLVPRTKFTHDNPRAGPAADRTRGRPNSNSQPLPNIHNCNWRPYISRSTSWTPVDWGPSTCRHGHRAHPRPRRPRNSYHRDRSPGHPLVPETVMLTAPIQVCHPIIPKSHRLTEMQSLLKMRSFGHAVASQRRCWVRQTLRLRVLHGTKWPLRMQPEARGTA